MVACGCVAFDHTRKHRPAAAVSTKQRAVVVVRAAQVSTNDFKNGLTVEVDGVPFKVIGARRVALAPPPPSAWSTQKRRACPAGSLRPMR